MKRYIRIILLCCVALPILASCEYFGKGQKREGLDEIRADFSVSGTVVNEKGEPFEGLKMYITSPYEFARLKNTVSTDAEGRYEIALTDVWPVEGEVTIMAEIPEAPPAEEDDEGEGEEAPVVYENTEDSVIVSRSNYTGGDGALYFGQVEIRLDFTIIPVEPDEEE